jgi:hypothetical protein
MELDQSEDNILITITADVHERRFVAVARIFVDEEVLLDFDDFDVSRGTCCAPEVRISLEMALKFTKFGTVASYS